MIREYIKNKKTSKNVFKNKQIVFDFRLQLCWVTMRTDKMDKILIVMFRLVLINFAALKHKCFCYEKDYCMKRRNCPITALMIHKEN